MDIFTLSHIFPLVEYQGAQMWCESQVFSTKPIEISNEESSKAWETLVCSKIPSQAVISSEKNSAKELHSLATSVYLSPGTSQIEHCKDAEQAFLGSGGWVMDPSKD